MSNLVKLIFLDIDGVLNAFGSYGTRTGTLPKSVIMGIEEEKVQILSKLIKETDALLILTSSWKVGWEKDKVKRTKHFDYLEEILAKYNLYITDKTDDLSFNRGHGIKKYLKKFKNKEIKYVILDDDIFSDYDNSLLKHLVKTDNKLGLTDEDVQKAISILNA